MKQSPVKKPVHKGKKAEPKAGKNVKKFGVYWGLDWLIRIKLYYVIDDFIFSFIFL